MSTEPNNQSNEEKAKDEAAAWMWKLDRGLSGAEQDAFFDWLSANPLHADLINEQKGDWERLDALAAWRPEHSDSPNPDLLQPHTAPSTLSLSRKLIWLPLAAAASIALIAWFNHNTNRSFLEPTTQTASAPAPTRLTLEDGSIIKLKDQTRITTQFTASERRVILEQGEAFFMVAKDPSRPFIVETNGLGIKAVGTAFNVRLGSDECEILVTEGIVALSPNLNSPDTPTRTVESPPLLQAYDKAVVSRLGNKSTLAVSKISRQNAHNQLIWRHDLLSFESTPLAVIIEELNQLNEIQLVLANRDLAKTEFNGSFRSDNLDGFVRLLELAYHLTAEKSSDALTITIKEKS